MPNNYSAGVDWTEDKTPILTGCRAAAVLAWLTFDVAGCTRCRLVSSRAASHLHWLAFPWKRRRCRHPNPTVETRQNYNLSAAV
jgi:hypothetical protein